ncbi:MAG: flagellar biosynthetic protein FliR [Bdellovibrionales bacterium]
MNLFQFNETELLAFVLVLLRVSTFLGMWPILGGGNIPRTAKILFSIVVTLVIFPLVGWQNLQTEIGSNLIAFLAFREIFVGLVLVFMMRLIFYTVDICGDIVAVTMGLSSAQIYNPASGSQNAVVSQVQGLMAAAFFLAINGHHFFIGGLVESFQLVPLSEAGLNTISGQTLGELAQTIVGIGLKLSAPILVSLFVLNIGMAIIGRAVPQINILITSFPVNILAGFLILLITIPAFLFGFQNGIDIVLEQMFQVLKSL